MKILNYINGKWENPVSGLFIDNIEPATGKKYGEIPDSDRADVDHAAQAAWKAFPAWSALPAGQRCDIMFKIADGIEQRLDEFAAAESRDNGKPVGLARVMDIPRAIENFKFFATAAVQFSSESHATGQDAINYTLRQPAGVAGCISPWNLPLYLFTWKIAPALASGCTVVAKPSELSPVTAFMLSEVCNAAGLPPGVLNIVHGLGHRAGQAIIEHPDIKTISFTGGTVTGKKISATAGPLFKKLSLELGGKNPNVIFADADMEKAVTTSVRSAFTNQGEICLCGSRIFIQRNVYESFRDAFIEKTRALKIGDPTQEENNLGALISAAHLEKVKGYVALALTEGGKILTGGQQVNPGGRCSEGYFYEPTVIEGLNDNCRINQEEIFGPVVTLIPFDTEEEVIRMANGTNYGLSATVWTENIGRGHRVAAALKCGIVWINCWLLRDLRTPFGGTNQSGVGREGGWEAMRFFTEAKNVCVKL
ncbi:MAG: aldehyde dehydrogenase [Bacteroidetes bacterium]|nr:aldehyde dehydrogenase [Bacteroidota bacterium]